MKQPDWIKKCINKSRDFNYQRQNYFLHNFMNLFSVAIHLIIIITVAILPLFFTFNLYGYVLYFLLASFTIGVSSFALFILVVHEASHEMFILIKNKKIKLLLNRISGWAVCLPLGVNYKKHWEIGHITHHLHPIEKVDPQANNRLTGKKLLKTCLLLLLLPGYAYFYRYLSKVSSVRKGHTNIWVQITFFAFWLTSLFLLYQFVSIVSAMALLHSLFVLMVLNQIKGSLEHGGEVAFHENPYLRSRTSLFLLRRFIMPFNITFHFEHHLAFAIPWYNLIRYHKSIYATIPDDYKKQIFNRQIWKQLKGELPKIS